MEALSPVITMFTVVCLVTVVVVVVTDPPVVVVVVPAYTTQCKVLIDPSYNASAVSAITLCPSVTSWYCIKTAEWIRLFLT